MLTDTTNSLVATCLDADSIKTRRDQTIGGIRQHLDWQRAEVDTFNAALQSALESSLSARLSKIRSDDALAASLGVPIKRTEGIPKTYVVPTVRSKPQISRASLGEPSTLEPVLAAEEYERI